MKFKECPHCKKSLESKLTQQRQKLEKSTEQIADEIGASRQVVRNWEEKGVIPSGKKLLKAAAAYKLTAGEFVEMIISWSEFLRINAEDC